MFGHGVAFNMNGDVSVKSCLGASLSLLIITVTLYYAQLRAAVLVDYGDTTYQETKELHNDSQQDYLK